MMRRSVPGEPSPFAQAAKAVAASGYHPIPIMPGDKAPGEFSGGRWRLMEGWPKWRDQMPAEFIIRLWSSWEGGNVGVVLGTRPTPDLEVIALDFDTDDTFLLEVIEAAVPVANVRKRGRRGYTGFYLAPVGTAGRRFKRGAAVIFEILTGNSTRQTIIPPSIHPDTHEPYKWLTPRTLADTPPLALVRLTTDMLERLVDTLESLEGVEEARPQRVPAADGAGSVWRVLNEAALANLEAWVPALALHKLKRTTSGYQAVPHWRPSSTGRSLGDRGRNLGIATTGIKDFGTDHTMSALDLVMVSCGWPLDDAFAWLGRRLGFVEEAWEPTDLPPHDPETGEVLEEVLEEQVVAAAPVVSDELPDHLTRVPGLLGDVIEWIVDTDRKPNRVLALGAAVAVIGTLVGRRIAGPTLSGTHLYIVALAPSGAGKDHALRQIDPLLKSASAGHLIGPDDFMSMTAVISVLDRSPLCLCAMDEFGAYIGRISHKRASPHEKGMTKVLRSAWGASFKTMRTPEYAGRESREISAPAMSIYGTSTPGEFFASLQSNDVINGFLNRLLVLQTAVRSPARDPLRDPFTVPKELRTALNALYMKANAVTVSDMSDPFTLRPKVLEWGAGAKAELALLQDEIEALSADEGVEDFYARTLEMAMRLATIRACGGAGIVSIDDMRWGREIAMWSARRMVEAAGEHMAGNEFAGYANRIVRFMKKKQHVVTRREIQAHLKSELKVKELTDLMDMLVESGRVVASRRERPEVGRPPTSPTYSLPPK